MPDELPKFIDARRLMEGAGTLSGVVSVARLDRIGSPFGTSKAVVVEFEVSGGDGNGLRFTGLIKTEVVATCQRCLDQMDVGIEKKFNVILVDATDAVPRALDISEDILAIDQGRIDIDQFVQDEVMLGCPMIPLHDNPECRASLDVQDTSGRDRKKPFAGLADMMAGMENNDNPEK